MYDSNLHYIFHIPLIQLNVLRPENLRARTNLNVDPFLFIGYVSI